MTGFSFRDGQPAIRSATPSNPWRCPWCGHKTWIVSEGDVRSDRGRVQMYCNGDECTSRETEVIIVRGDGAHLRADVRALSTLDNGGGDVVARREGQTPPYRLRE